MEPIRILIVEDLSTDVELARRVLKKENIEFIDQVVDSENAFQSALTGFSPHLIISDYSMPTFDGMRALLMARARAAYIPFIVLTGSMNEETAVACMKAGADDYVLKEKITRLPFAVREALEKVKVKTEKNQAEEERSRLMSAIEQAGEVFVITDIDARIVYVNPAFEQVTGFLRHEVIGKNPRILKSGVQNAAFYREMWDTLTRGETWRGRLVNRRKDGTHYTEEAVISPVRDKTGAVIHYSAVKRDITEHLKSTRMLQQAQRMEAVGRLAGGVAHDYNNMLGVILGYAELALDQMEPDNPVHENLTEIFNAARRSSDITRQLLAFARKQTIAPEVLDINDTVEGMLKILRRLIGEDIDLAWQPHAGLWPVKIDPSQIDQILANLCVNARDAISDVGKLTIETKNVCFDESYCKGHDGLVPGDYVQIAVSDNGCGMDKETLAQIFEPFFTTKGLGKGTGLGLATVYGIVHQNNGLITVDSEPGKGTTFTLYLPRYAGEDAQTLLNAPVEIPRGNGETILLVEDEAAIQRVGRIMLENLGYRVRIAECPDEALGLSDEDTQHIDLLITDVVMPCMNGRDLAERITARCPSINVLFMSGYTAEAIARHGVLDRGINFMQKPFTKKDLAEKVRRALNR
jgi:PAS domain S-box-containing protein